METEKPQKSIFQKFQDNNKLIREIYELIKKNKKWWLLPILIFFTFISIFWILLGGAAILPVIYALF